MRRFSQVDVFTNEFLLGNPVAVVHDADALTTQQMAALARWTNLSETTFLLTPNDAVADYSLRIFTPNVELPFAGHPTLGSARAWLEAGGVPQHADELIQECPRRDWCVYATAVRRWPSPRRRRCVRATWTPPI